MLKGCVLTPRNQEERVSDSIPRRGTTTMDKIINDFTINIATANGTGSQSANLILLQSLFDMGVPVSGKNLFPSNISGLPTWYIVRLSDHGIPSPWRPNAHPSSCQPCHVGRRPGCSSNQAVVIWNSETKEGNVTVMTLFRIRSQ
jgi:2-oxoglutarate ferredoxin oxidoreductase subunit alpha